MPNVLALAETDIPALIQRLSADSSLFRGIAPAALADLLRHVAHRVELGAGEDLVTEDDEADSVCFVESGRLEVLKFSSTAGCNHRIGSAGPGAVVGEVALLDRGRRSATVRALEPARALVLRIGDLDREASASAPPATQMRLNLAGELARRVRDSTDNTVRHLEASLAEAQTRAEMGGFMSRVLIGTCLYMYAMVLMHSLKDQVADSTAFSVLVLLGFAFGLYLNIRASRYPVSAYGFTFEGWKPALREAIVYSLPILALIVGIKWALIETAPAFAGARLFDWYAHKGLSLPATLLVVAAYALFVPVQEMVARSGIQSSLMMFLRSRHKVPMSILMSTLLFSSTHLHTNFAFAAVVFPVGLFWGWLYSRHPTLIGVVASHLLIGIWAVFVVSFPFF